MAKDDDTKGPQINWVGAIGSGLGSVTSAVLLSTTGAAGTWIGAGIGTFIITVGGAIYGYYLQRAKTGIENTADKLNLPAPPSKKRARENPKTITAQKDPNDAARSEPPPEDDDADVAEEEKAKPTFKEALRNINWKRVTGWALVLFVITMGIILVFELATGRPVSSYTGGSSPDSTGTSVTGVFDPERGDEPQENPLAPVQDPEQQPEEELEQPEEAPLEEEPQPDVETPEEEVPPPGAPEPEQLQQQAPQQQQPQPEQGIEAPQ